MNFDSGNTTYTALHNDDTNRDAKCVLKLKRKYIFCCVSQPRYTLFHTLIHHSTEHAPHTFSLSFHYGPCWLMWYAVEHSSDQTNTKNKRCVRVPMHPSPSIGIMITNRAQQQENIILASKHYYIHVSIPFSLSLFSTCSGETVTTTNPSTIMYVHKQKLMECFIVCVARH